MCLEEGTISRMYAHVKVFFAPQLRHCLALVISEPAQTVTQAVFLFPYGPAIVGFQELIAVWLSYW